MPRYRNSKRRPKELSALPTTRRPAARSKSRQNKNLESGSGSIRTDRTLAIPAVAVLVLLAGAARAILVAADLAPARRILRVAVRRGDGHQRGAGERHFGLAGVR